MTSIIAFRHGSGYAMCGDGNCHNESGRVMRTEQCKIVVGPNWLVGMAGVVLLGIEEIQHVVARTLGVKRLTLKQAVELIAPVLAKYQLRVDLLIAGESDEGLAEVCKISSWPSGTAVSVTYLGECDIAWIGEPIVDRVFSPRSISQSVTETARTKTRYFSALSPHEAASMSERLVSMGIELCDLVGDFSRREGAGVRIIDAKPIGGRIHSAVLASGCASWFTPHPNPTNQAMN